MYALQNWRDTDQNMATLVLLPRPLASLDDLRLPLDEIEMVWAPGALLNWVVVLSRDALAARGWAGQRLSPSSFVPAMTAPHGVHAPPRTALAPPSGTAAPQATRLYWTQTDDLVVMGQLALALPADPAEQTVVVVSVAIHPPFDEHVHALSQIADQPIVAAGGMCAPFLFGLI